MSAEGDSREWAAAAGTGLGVVGGLSSAKLQGSGKRRVEPGKNSEKKKRRLSKGKEKNNAEEVESQADLIDLNVSAEFPKDGGNGDVCDEVETSAAASLRNCSPTLLGTRNGSGDDTVDYSLESYPDRGLTAEASEFDRCSTQHNGMAVPASGCQGRLTDAVGSQGSHVLTLDERIPPTLLSSNELTPGECVSPEAAGQVLVGDMRKVTFRDPNCELAATYHYGKAPSQGNEGHSESSSMEDVIRSAPEAQRSVCTSSGSQAKLLGQMHSPSERKPKVVTSRAPDGRSTVSKFLQNSFSNSHDHERSNFEDDGC